MFIDISTDIDDGGFEAFVVSKGDVNYKNYLEDFGVDEEYLSAFDNLDFQNITVLKNLWVDEDSQGQGVGSELLEKAFDGHFEVNADLIVVVADNSEADFSVSDWYSRNGFEEVSILGNGFHYMIFSQHDDLIDNYRNIIFNKVTP